MCGPSIPKMMSLDGEEIHQSNSGWSPVYVEENLGVMSIGFMLPDADDPVIWRGPRKNGEATTLPFDRMYVMQCSTVVTMTAINPGSWASGDNKGTFRGCGRNTR